jgi:hypothetical protein
MLPTVLCSYLIAWGDVWLVCSLLLLLLLLLAASPPQSCTEGLKSNPGSTSFSDCKNPAGFSYSSEGANQCPDNHYATKGKMVSKEAPAVACTAACNGCILNAAWAAHCTADCEMQN